MILNPVFRTSPVRALGVFVVAMGIVAIVKGRATGAAGDPPCSPLDAECGTPTPTLAVDGTPAPLPGSEFCRNVGYLCAGLNDMDLIRLHRWKDFDGTIVVHIPIPDFEEPKAARDLQIAAAQGIRAWNSQPFPILVDLRGDRNPHFSVSWTRSLGGDQLGVARTQWSQATGLRVLSVDLTTRNPLAPRRPVDTRQIRLTAAHEMGHALGLPHSASPRDVMYPSNTATSMSAQDYRSVEVLYQTRDGTVVTR